jgi:hypothetical protein
MKHSRTVRRYGFLGMLMLIWVSWPSGTAAGISDAKWAFVGFTKYRDALFIDMNRLSVEADMQIQIWSRITPSDHSKYLRQIRRDLRTAGKSSRDFRYIETLNEIDCRNNRIRYLKVIYYQDDGSVIHATRDDNPQWKLINSGSLWDSLRVMACDRHTVHGCREPVTLMRPGSASVQSLNARKARVACSRVLPS